MECDIASLRKSLSLQEPELEKERIRIDKEIALEEKNYPTLSVPKIKFFLTALKKGNINDMKYRKTVITVFVNSIYLYNEKITLIFNSGDKPVTINDLLLSEIEAGMETGHKINQKGFILCPEVVEAEFSLV
jgi:hypothetical protein